MLIKVRVQAGAKKEKLIKKSEDTFEVAVRKGQSKEKLIKE